MNKVSNEPSFFVKKKALISEKMNRYLWIFLLLFVTEIAIALLHFHRIVRGFIGDVLAIPLLFYFGKWITKFSEKRILLFVIFVAFSTECMQLLKLAPKLGIENKAFYILFGNTFDAWDLVAYLIGGLAVILFEHYF